MGDLRGNLHQTCTFQSFITIGNMLKYDWHGCKSHSGYGPQGQCHPVKFKKLAGHLVDLQDQRP